MNQNSQVATIQFHGQPLITAKIGDKVFVAMKPICEAIGLQWEAQYKRINRHPVLKSTMSMMDMVAEDGKTRQLITLPLEVLNGWLFGVDASRVKEECRPKLVEYQTEGFQVLYDYWNTGIAINPRMQYAVNPGDSLTKEEADTLRGMLEGAAKKAHPGDGNKQGAFIRTGWSKLKSHFKVSYRDIPRVEFTEAVSLISRHVIDGEYIPADAAVNAENEAKINVQELMLGGYSTPTVKLPDEVQRAVDQQAFSMAHECFTLCQTYLTRKVAYNSEIGQPRRIDSAKALQAIADSSLADALTHTFKVQLDRLIGFADMVVISANGFRKDVHSAKLAISA